LAFCVFSADLATPAGKAIIQDHKKTQILSATALRRRRCGAVGEGKTAIRASPIAIQSILPAIEGDIRVSRLHPDDAPPCFDGLTQTGAGDPSWEHQRCRITVFADRISN
jgi:hypothetical protein